MRAVFFDFLFDFLYLILDIYSFISNSYVILMSKIGISYFFLILLILGVM